jgi:Ulp1 protease family, C-terminal catalytic domain
MGTVEHGEAMYDIAVYCRGRKLSLYTLKGLETVYGSNEVATIKLLEYRDDCFVPSWLNDDIIDTRLSILELDYPQLQVVNCSRVQWWIKGDDSIDFRFRGEKKFGATHVLLPLNAHGNHWTLLIFYVEENYFVHLDPLFSAMTSDPLLDILKDRLAAELGVPCSTSVVKTMKNAKQNNNSDCGLFVIHFAMLCAQGLPFTNPCDPIKLRREIFESILQHME